MKHPCKLINFDEQSVSGKPSLSVPSGARRRFLTLFTAGTTSLALQACGGGNTGSSVAAAPVASAPPTTPASPGSAPVPPPSTVAWETVPDITFTQGVPSSVSLAQWLATPAGAAVAISLNPASLPPGVTFNAQGKTLNYDGAGAVAESAGHVLTASGG